MLKILGFFLLVFVVLANHCKRPVQTKVTFLYDIKRGDLQEYKRPFQYYLGFFDQLLRTQSNLIVFGDKNMEEFVWKRRQQHNTVFVLKELNQFKDAWYSNLTEKARKQFPQRREPQYTLQYYCLIVFGKLYVMKEAIKYDKWNTDFLVWNDGGIMHVFDQARPGNFVRKYFQSIQPIWFHTNVQTRTNNYPTFKEGQTRYIGRRTKNYQQVWAGIMGGNIHVMADILHCFEYLLRLTLQNGDMFTEQSIVTLIPIRYSLLMPTSSTIRIDAFYHNYQVYEQVRNDHLINPRHFHAKIDTELQIVHSAKPINFSASTHTQDKAFLASHGQRVGPVFTLNSFKKATDRLLIRMKSIFVAVLWVFLLLIFCKNRGLEKELALKPKKNKMPL